MLDGLLNSKFVARLLATFAGAALCAGAEPATLLREVRYWSSIDTTRVAIETTQDVEFTHGELAHPYRVFIDLVDVFPRQSFKGLAYSIPVDDGLVKRIRVAPNRASVTRVVLDLTGPVEITTGKLVNPPRIVVDVRKAKAVPGEAPPLPVIEAPAPAPKQISSAVPPPPASSKQPEPPKRPATTAASVQTPPQTALTGAASRPSPDPDASKPTVQQLTRSPGPPVQTPPEAALSTVPEPASKTDRATSVAGKPEPVATLPNRRTAEPARLVTPSLTRALGLKIHRVALDAGHGGFDPGSDGPTGLVEKELALDITLRLGKLLEERSGIEVLYTRKDDSFVDLHERAPLANRAKADLFLSIHANTAPVRVLGTETYYLNRGETKEDLALATRENATSGKSVFELGDLVKQIVAYDKRDESRQFAAAIQSATHELSRQTYGRLYNRGVRHSPLVVLIGATMPAVLVEVGFISNPKEEALLKKPEHRQKVAEALYKGILKYSESLSHFTLAQTED